MTCQRRRRIAEAEALLQQEYDEGLKEGLAYGKAAAERILTWWLSNNQLVVPHSQETLERWSKDAIAKLAPPARK